MESTTPLPLNGGMRRPGRQTKRELPRQFKATYIRDWREFRDDMTLEELGDRIGMTASNLSMLERGLRGYTQETLEAIAAALNTSVAALLSRAPSREADEWAAWDNAEPADRRLALELLKTAKNNRP